MLVEQAAHQLHEPVLDIAFALDIALVECSPTYGAPPAGPAPSMRSRTEVRSRSAMVMAPRNHAIGAYCDRRLASTIAAARVRKRTA
jgi:hypothetical protein